MYGPHTRGLSLVGVPREPKMSPIDYSRVTHLRNSFDVLCVEHDILRLAFLTLDLGAGGGQDARSQFPFFLRTVGE